jgi:2-polyprenylphenol 6-hydroxylase
MPDITIIGTGVVGLTSALLLAQNSCLQILVLDAKSDIPSWQPDHYDPRVYAITPSSQKTLNTINAWPDIVAKRAGCFKFMEVWDGASKGKIRFSHQELNLNELGFIVEENLLRSVLYEKIKNLPNIELKSPIILESLEEHSEGVELQCQGLPAIKTKLVIGADGIHSWVRGQAGIAMTVQDYHHTALIAHVYTEKTHQDTAWQCFVSGNPYPAGPLAFLPLADAHKSSIVWSVQREKAEILLSLSDNDFAATVTKAFEERLGQISQVSTRYSFPLYERQAERYVKNHIALVGDAIHTLHPLAGQGVNLGISDATCLARVIQQALQKGRAYHSYDTLRRYERERKRNNALMLAAVKGLKYLFENENEIIKRVRSQGLNFTDKMSLLKNLFVAHAISS